MTQRTTVAVLGMGGVGATVAAALDPSLVDVLMCRNGHPQPMTLIEDGVETVIRGRVLAGPAEVDATVDWVVLATKRTVDPSSWLDRLVGPTTRIAVLQNGIELAEEVARWVPEDRCVPVVVRMSSERVGADSVVVRAAGRLLTDDSPAAREFAGLVGPRVPVVHFPDFAVQAWHKLAFNIVVNSLTTITGGMSVTAVGPALLPIARQLLEETTTAGRAAGVDLPESDVEVILEQIRRFPPVQSSTQLDHQQGRPLEHRFLTGAVLAVAERTGTPVPTVRAVHGILDALSPVPASAPGAAVPALQH
jgi:2-dehydropantoate 2-reductase